MKNGVKTRLAIHNILYEVLENNLSLNDKKVKNIFDKFNNEDKSFINNVSLTSMRKYFHIKKVLNELIKKKSKKNQEILLISAISQILYVNIPSYAVINTSVELAKKLKVYPGLINSCLKRVDDNKKNFKEIKILFKDLPNWFLNKTKNFSNLEKGLFLKNFSESPSLHLVFKEIEFLNKFNHRLLKTSSLSGYLVGKSKVNELEGFKTGNWWIQDFASFAPIACLNFDINKKNIIDLCSAPGGKSFQLLSKSNNVVLNDKKLSRIKILKENLKRLRFEAQILNEDVLNLNLKQRFDLVVLDSPCSSIGTMHKNPDILVRKNSPKFDKLEKLQEDLLIKSSSLVKEDGVLLYMVCSFLESETTKQINKFLKNNKNFSLVSFKNNGDILNYKNMFKNKFMLTLPDKIEGYLFDGFFAACLKKNSD